MAVGFLYLLVARFNIDLEETWAKIKGGNLVLYLLAFLVYYATFPLRGWRWRVIASNIGVDKIPGARLPSVAECSNIILLGWFGNCIAPFRLGDAYRAYLFTEDAKAPFSSVAGTVVAERIIDTFLMVLALLFVAGMAFLLQEAEVELALRVLGAGLGLVILSASAIFVMARFGISLERFIPERLVPAYRRFLQGTLGSFKQMPLVTILGIAVWSLEIGRLFLVMQALGLSLSFHMLIFVTLANALLSVVPITPGGLGILEPGVVGLLQLSLTKGEAVSVVILDRSISYVSILILGAIAFLVRQVLQSRKRVQASAHKGIG